MKGKKATFIIVSSILTISILGSILFLLPKDKMDPRQEQIDEKKYTDTLTTTVESGEITSTLKCNGSVLKDETSSYIETITVEFSSKKQQESFHLSIKAGDDIQPGDTIYSIANKKFKSKINGKFTDIQIEDLTATLHFLNFNKLLIETTIPLDKANLVKLDSKVELQIRYNEKKTSDSFEGSVTHIGYEVTDYTIPVRIKTNEQLLPGTQLDVSFSITKNYSSLYILKQMLQKDENGYFVEKLNPDGTRERKSVEIGDSFQAYNNNKSIDYVEIKKGLAEGEKIIVDIINTNK